MSNDKTSDSKITKKNESKAPETKTITVKSGTALPQESQVPIELPKPETVFRFLIMGAATIIILAGIKIASVIVAPMLLALFLTIILLVPLRWLQRKGCPTLISLAVVLGCTLVISLGISYVVGKSINDFMLQLPEYKSRITRKAESLEKKLEQYGIVLGGKKDADKDKKDEKSDEKKPGDAQGKDAKAPDSPGKTTDKPEPPESKSNTLEPAKKPIIEEKPVVPDVIESKRPGTEEPGPNRVVPVTVTSGDGTTGDAPAGTDDTTDKTGIIDPNGDPQTKGDPANPEDDATATKTAEEAAQELETILHPKGVEKPPLISLDTENVMYWVTKSMFELKTLAESGFLVIIFTIFMLLEAAQFPAKVDRAFGKEGPINFGQFQNIAEEIRRYLFLKAIACVMSSSAATLVYVLFDVPAPLLWGVIAFFLYFIPNIGGIIASIIPGLLIFMNSDVEGVLLYAVCLVAIECTIGYGIEPKMLGYGLRISVVVILLSLIGWGWILGPVGLFLAAPLTIMVKIILQSFKETEWIAVLLDDKVHAQHGR